MRLRNLSVALLAAIISVLFVANAKAIPITYTETATISGSLNGVSFANKLLTLTGTGDTAAVAPHSFALGNTGFINPVTATFSVAGTGSGSLTGSYDVFVNQTAEAVGFTTDNITKDLLNIFGPAAFGSYALSTSIGPITDDAEWSSGVSFPSTAGALIIQTVLNEEGTFAAAVGGVVPLPGALPLFITGLAMLGLLGWRRKRKASA